MEKLVLKLKKGYKIQLWKLILLGIFAILVVAVLSFFAASKQGDSHTKGIITSIKPIRENNFNYQYIFPLLSYDFSQANKYYENQDAKKELSNYINLQYKNKSAESISVYVRNFRDNKWVGVNQETQYHPGSLLKVLIMMAYYRQAQLDPAILGKEYVYSKSVDTDANSLPFNLPTKLKVGQTYTVKELMQEMIANSDNGAETLLIDKVDRQILNNAYNDLNIPNPDSTSGDYTISARQYVAFLRILYNSTYLTESFSEQALSVMSESSYLDGIVAGIPRGIVAAQKYGERVNSSNGIVESVELHNCGIVYAEKNPYSICVMTKGQDEKKLTSIIKEISALIYKNEIEHTEN